MNSVIFSCKQSSGVANNYHHAGTSVSLTLHHRLFSDGILLITFLQIVWAQVSVLREKLNRQTTSNWTLIVSNKLGRKAVKRKRRFQNTFKRCMSSALKKPSDTFQQYIRPWKIISNVAKLCMAPAAVAANMASSTPEWWSYYSWDIFPYHSLPRSLLTRTKSH